MTAHWGWPDPAAAAGSEAQKLQAFQDAAVAMKRRIELMLALPLPTLDKMSLQKAVRDIGQA
jgi:arsenate reductase